MVRTTSRGERHGALLKGLDRILQVEKREGVEGRGKSPRREREGVLFGQGESSVSTAQDGQMWEEPHGAEPRRSC